VQASRTGRVGVIGTVGTISSGAYVHAVEAVTARTNTSAELSSAACPGFVEFVERGQLSGDEVMVLAERLLAPLAGAKIDTLLLGCTHYPFLARTIGEVMGPDVVLVSSADETAFAVRDRLAEMNLLRLRHDRGNRRFLSSGDVDAFRELGAALFGSDLVAAERWER
jgi:glutamate racemase